MRIPEALLVELLAAAGIYLEYDHPFWYATDARLGEPLAQGSDAGYVARAALTAVRARLDQVEALAPGVERALGDARD